MKVALIQANVSYDNLAPLGILYIGTVLDKAGHDVLILDICPNDKNYLDKLVKFNPKLVGFSIVTSTYSRSDYLLKQIRKILLNAKYCAGGIHPTVLPKESLKELNLDFVVIGEGEYSMLEAVERLEKGKSLKNVKGIMYEEKNKIIMNKPREAIENLDTLPFLNWKLIDNYKWYFAPPGSIRGLFYDKILSMMTSRGCPYRCIFCASHTLFGRRVRRRSVKNVIDELRYLKKEFDINGVSFFDDTFTIDSKWVKDFCNALKKEKINIIWSCQVRVNTINEEILKLMREVGCLQVDIGVESGSDEILKNLKKDTNVEVIKRAFKLTKKVGMRTFASYIIGNPGETMEDIEKTKELAREVKANMSMFCILVPYPGSELFEIAMKNRWLNENAFYFSDKWQNKQSENPVMEINFSKDKLIKIRAQLENMFSFNNYYLIVIGFLRHQKYLFKLGFSVIKHSQEIVKSMIDSIKKQKIRLVLETVYQKFNEDLRK